MRPIDASLAEFLQAISSAMPVRQGLAYNSIADFVLKRGFQASTEPYTAAEEKVVLDAFKAHGNTPKIKACFYNAQSLAAYDVGLEYAEGYVMPSFIHLGIEHGWNLLPSGKVVDVTLRERGEGDTCSAKKLLERAKRNLANSYYGVPFDMSEILSSWHRTGSSGMLLADPLIQSKVFELPSPD